MVQLVEKRVLTDVVAPVQITQKSNLKETLGKVGGLATGSDKMIEEQLDPALVKMQDQRFNQTLNFAKESMNESYNEFSDDPTKFQETNLESATKFADTLEDPEMKEEFMARFRIQQAPYQAKVEKNFAIKEEKKYIKSQRMAFDNAEDSAVDNASLFYTKELGYKEAKAELNSAYNSRFDMDSNGNNIYTASQIKSIEETYDDRNLNGVKGFIDDKMFMDDNAIKSLKTEMLDDKNGFMEKEDLTSSQYNEVIKYIKSYETATKQVEKKKKLAPEEQEILIKNAITLETIYDDMKLTQDKDTGKTSIKNEEYQDVNSLIDFRTRVDELYKEGGLSDATYIKYKADTNRALINMVESEDSGFSGEQWFEKSTSNRMANMINTKLKTASDVDRAMIFESAYKDMISKKISPDSSDNSDKAKVDRITQESIMGYLGDVEPAMAYTMARDNSEYGSFLTRDGVIDFFTPKDKKEGELAINPDGFSIPTGGYSLEYKDGKLMSILRDSSGNILDESEAM